MPTTDTPDDAIRSLIAELVEASPPAPLLGELDDIEVHPRRAAPAQRTRRCRLRLAALTWGFGVACLAALLLVLFLPDTGQRIPSAEAAQLRLIATNAADQPVQHLGRNQWIMNGETISYLDSETEAGSTPAVGVEATISAKLDQWSNRFGESCSSITFGPATFATPADRSSWLSLGLLESPINQPMKSCVDIVGANVADGTSYVIDVSHLPTNPSTLADELEAGTTKILQIDDAGSTADPSSGLQRVAMLLVEPTEGSSPVLTSAIYKALALMPGIQKLGRVTSHSGAVGLGFSAESPEGPEGPRTIVVDPGTGRVLEAENIQFSSVIGTVFSHPSPFIGASPSLPSRDLSGHVTIQWVDIGSAQSIVDTDQLPTGLAETRPPNVVITAVAKPGVPYTLLATLQEQLDARFGAPGGGYGYYEAPGGAVMSFSFSGSEAQVNEFARGLRASNLIASVKVDQGDS